MSSYEVLYWHLPMCQLKCQTVPSRTGTCPTPIRGNYVLDDATWTSSTCQQQQETLTQRKAATPDIIADLDDLSSIDFCSMKSDVSSIHHSADIDLSEMPFQEVSPFLYHDNFS